MTLRILVDREGVHVRHEVVAVYPILALNEAAESQHVELTRDLAIRCNDLWIHVRRTSAGDPAKLLPLLSVGASKARGVADPVLERASRAMGIAM